MALPFSSTCSTFRSLLGVGSFCQTRPRIDSWIHRTAFAPSSLPDDVGAFAEHLQERDFTQSCGRYTFLFHLWIAVRTVGVSTFVFASDRSRPPFVPRFHVLPASSFSTRQSFQCFFLWPCTLSHRSLLPLCSASRSSPWCVPWFFVDVFRRAQLLLPSSFCSFSLFLSLRRARRVQRSKCDVQLRRGRAKFSLRQRAPSSFVSNQSTVRVQPPFEREVLAQLKEKQLGRICRKRPDGPDEAVEGRFETVTSLGGERESGWKGCGKVTSQERKKNVTRGGRPGDHPLRSSALDRPIPRFSH